MIAMKAIGIVHSTRTELIDDHWDTVISHIDLDAAQFEAEALAGLDAFSHVQITFYMDQVDPKKIERGARHPRNDKRLPKVGIWAQRGKNRPNQIGQTISRVSRVDGLRLYVEGLDAVDGTPVLDIKPWMEEFGPRGAIRQTEWSREIMKDYW